MRISMSLTWIKNITRKKAVRIAITAIDGVKLVLTIRKQILSWKVPISGNPADHVTSEQDERWNILIQEFSQLSSGCINCHQDVHNRQFEETGGTDCLKCHGYADWTASRFDHDQTAFKLEGKHESVACNKCHIPVVEAGITYTEYKLKDYSCESCH